MATTQIARARRARTFAVVVFVVVVVSGVVFVHFALPSPSSAPHKYIWQIFAHSRSVRVRVLCVCGYVSLFGLRSAGDSADQSGGCSSSTAVTLGFNQRDSRTIGTGMSGSIRPTADDGGGGGFCLTLNHNKRVCLLCASVCVCVTKAFRI